MQHLENLENDASNAMFLIISDIELDQPLVPEKLLELFQGFEQTFESITQESQEDSINLEGTDSDNENFPHLVFLLVGSFVTKPIAVPGGRQAAQSTFSSLGDIISSCPNISRHAKFVLIPGGLFMLRCFSRFLCFWANFRSR